MDEEGIRPILTWQRLIPALERALIDLSAGRAQQPYAPSCLCRDTKPSLA